MRKRSITMSLLIISFALSTVLSAQPATGATLAGWWKLDETSGTAAADSSGNGRNGTVVGGAKWIAGTNGGAIQLTSVGDRIDLPAMELDTSSGATLTAWIKSATTQRDWCGVIFTRVGSQAGIWITNSRELRYTWGSAAAGWNFASGLVAPDNQWAFVALVIEPKQATIYLNDTSKSYSATHSGVRFNGTTYIGWDSDGNNKYFAGAIDDCRIYTGALTAAEIAAILAPPVTGSAKDPNPMDEARDVSLNMSLSWTPGPYAATHDVYLGTSLNDVNTATVNAPLGVLVSQGQTAATYTPGQLQLGQTYYWCVDEVNAAPSTTVFKGPLWSFTVEPMFYQVTNVTATASSFDTGKGPENTINSSGLTADLHGTDNKTMWNSSMAGAQPTWIQYDLGGIYKLEEMWVWNHNTDYELSMGMGIKNASIEYSTDGTNWTTLGATHDFAQGSALADYAHNTTVDFGGVAVRQVKITANTSWSGRAQYGLSEVRFYYMPVVAREPSPASNAIEIAPDVTLSWRAGRQAALHNVYLGTDPNALTLAGAPTANSYAPAGLNLGTKYYWRVDEVNAVEAISTWTGEIWNFKTSEFIAVDDMESYNDTTNKIFESWVDGYGSDNNGSIVGVNDAKETGTFGSTTIFYAGKQSMPLFYGTNNITNSETTRTFTPAQDWTRNGVKFLTVNFYGQATNATNVPLWVKIADQNGKSAKVTFGTAAGEDMSLLADPAWTTWNIPLSSFGGVTLTKITSMTIGLGTGSGAGTLYIDDIRLYPTAATPAGITPTLVGWWELDSDVKDSSGNSNNGTITGTPTYAAAKVGWGLKLNGTTDYVDCGAAASLNITDQVTLSAWIQPTNFANSAYQTFVGKGDHAYNIQHTEGNAIEFFVYDGTWYTASSAAVASTMNNTWHHVAGTFDGVQLKLFVDGAMVASSLHTGDIDTATHTVSIGSNSEQSGRLFTGTIDEVRIYRGALPTAEIKKLANP